MHSKVYSATLQGLKTYLVETEVDISSAEKLSIHIVGLGDATIQESKKRMLAAIRNSGINLPPRYITLNLAPADLRKIGTGFDLPMAIGMLDAIGAISLSTQYTKETIFIGELGLDGEIKPVPGIFSIALDAKKLGKIRLVMSSSSQINTPLEGIEIIQADCLYDLVNHYVGKNIIKPISITKSIPKLNELKIDFKDVRGQYQAKRALQIAAAGHHHSIMMGPPGSGKTMLAQRLQTIVPAMEFNEMLEVTRIHSASGHLGRNELMSSRPFRSPHHTISYGGLVGGGSKIQPGEITLSHKGILFLDEITEFTKKTLEVLRQPLEDKKITISRAATSLTFPADFLLVAAFNPCPCGFYGDGSSRCACPKISIDHYLKKLSGPFLDRIDIQLVLQAVTYQQSSTPNEKCSLEMSSEIELAIMRQVDRGIKNGDMDAAQVQKYCIVTPEAEKVIELAMDRLKLSMRGKHKILKVAKTIADIDDQDMIDASHIKEALSYRQIDQKLANIM